MKKLKNWDKKTWLSSPKYISSIINFLEKRIKFNKDIKILDVGCGRGKIISTLSKKYQMINLPLGVDIVDHKNAVNRIKFIKINAEKYLSKTKKKFDLILFKQSIHFFKFTKIKKILNYSQKVLNPNGKIIVLTLYPKKIYWPSFKVFQMKLIQSLKKDEKILDLIKYNFKNYKINYFIYKVKINKNSYLRMIKNKFTSCLLNLSSKALNNGVEEIKKNYKKKLVFYDKLICISYTKK